MISKFSNTIHQTTDNNKVKGIFTCSRRNRTPQGVIVMQHLMNKEGRGVEIKTAPVKKELRVDEYRKRIADETYLDHAIRKIATDLSHYLTK
jgi:hypothetical protein